MIVPVPFLFNPLKHHLGYIRTYIENTSENQLQNDLLRIGESQMDLYFGELLPEELCRQMKTQLTDTHSFEKEDFFQMIHRHQYLKLKVVDDSEWVLRKGNDPGRYIHMHPGRYSPHTVRVKASTLKTAIAYQVVSGERNVSPDVLNKVRKEMLHLSPLARIYKHSGIGKMINSLQVK